MNEMKVNAYRLVAGKPSDAEVKNVCSFTSRCFHSMELN
jgi:hypothetical protein